MREIVRQGDVLLRRVTSVPKEAVEVVPSANGHILAEGEVTGHAHRVRTEHAQMFALGALVYLKVLERTQLLHEEHGPIELREGNYQVIRQREYTPQEIRQVAD